VYDYPDIVNRVFKLKLNAFKARLFSGAAWGPHTSEVTSDGTTQWKFPIKPTSSSQTPDQACDDDDHMASSNAVSDANDPACGWSLGDLALLHNLVATTQRTTLTSAEWELYIDHAVPANEHTANEDPTSELSSSDSEGGDDDNDGVGIVQPSNQPSMSKTHHDAVRLIKALLGTKPRRSPLTDTAYLLEELPRITARSARYAPGYMIDVIEFQQRGLPHAHMAIRLACAPKEMNVQNTTGEVKEAPWIDQFICARKPTFGVLEEYCMLIRKPNVASMLPADYHYDVHPEIVAELMVREGQYFGRSITPTEFQRYMCRLVLNRESCAPDLYGGGPHEHGPHLNPTTKLQDPTCTEGCKRGKCKPKSDSVTCKSNYPFPAQAATVIAEDGFPRYRRNPGDEFIVPYNPWFVFKFDAHINVEYAASSNCITYLYKYLFKGSRGERAKFQLRKSNDQGGEQEAIDETKEYWNGKITSSMQATWEGLNYPMHSAYPTVHKVTVHETNTIIEGHGISDLQK